MALSAPATPQSRRSLPGSPVASDTGATSGGLLRTSVSLPSLRDTLGRGSRFGNAIDGGEPINCMNSRVYEQGLHPVSLKDLITTKTKGGGWAPYADNAERPVAGVDKAVLGGSYRSYSDMMVHRVKHTRTMVGPELRFTHDVARGPPASSMDHGFGKQKLIPPKYPINSSVITKTVESIRQSTKNCKPR
eukprot:TRINITY_DN24824_c0_g1_i1.p1 TRINITY_DN24824_c0_g1~~TRINITY_DN24824_c0_g1_i1.p1  ORF type:complete len:217 (+),score=33.40 TRINITY_DN24824_c0_g1_i1:82-651(+)